jgi:membrane peptidoglycan carboxypeptidase
MPVTGVQRREIGATARRPSASRPPLRRARPRTRRRSAPSWAFRGLILVGLLSMLIGVTAVGATSFVAVTSFATLSRDLPDPKALATLSFEQPTIVYDRSGKVELGRFERASRHVVGYREIPPLVLDTTTTAEDRTFWANDGYDLQAMIAATIETLQGDGRGASTITQQLVRARLLPAEVVDPTADVYVRKAKEIIQSARLTQTFPGQTGKQQIITAYLNQVFYGHGAYGIAAAAQIYFGISKLSELTPAEAALLAALPKSPSSLDPYHYAVRNKKGQLVVPRDAPPMLRRDYILDNLATSRWTHLTPEELEAAKAEPVVLHGDEPLIYRAPHFMWQVRAQLEDILGSADAVETGGYRVTTTLDWRAQQIAQRQLQAAAVTPNLQPARAARLMKRLDIPRQDRGWINRLRGKDLHNGAIVVLDYRTGDVRAYVGSAGYYLDGLRSRRFEPKFDAAGVGFRQPGSAFKPVLYATAFERKALTPGSLLLDITTHFDRSQNWAPKDADGLDRGPVLVRQALQMSLNIPAIRALQRVGNEAVADEAARMGLPFQGGKRAFVQAGLAGALGTVETRPLDLIEAYGTIANNGVHEPARMILEIQDQTGKVVYRAPDAGKRALSATAAYQVTDILKGNTNPAINEIWAAKLAIGNGPHGERRPAAAKTGTATDARDLSTYGYLAPPANPRAPALAVGVWLGNSDHSMPRSSDPAISLTAAAPLWRSVVRQLTNGQPVADFREPNGLVRTRIDAWSGGAPGPWTRETRSELFRAGTQPGAKNAIDRPGLLYSASCGTWVVDPVKAELGPRSWDADVYAWLARARRGVGVMGSMGSRTAYFWDRSGWGGPLAGGCVVPRSDHGNDRGNGHGNGNGPPPGHGPPGGPPGEQPPDPPKP